jgi:O-methyltransferase involved in polyketide biosynthesis
MHKMQFSVTDTNLEALKAKKSAVILGYMKDDFINCIVPEHIRKEVVLNKGYWSRYYCIYNLIQNFLNDCEDDVQVVSLGCGLDTMPFNMIQQFKDQNKKINFSFFECDLKSVVEQKIKFITSNGKFDTFLLQNCKDTIITNDFINSDRYNIFDADLDDVGYLEQQLSKFGFNKEFFY